MTPLRNNSNDTKVVDLDNSVSVFSFTSVLVFVFPWRFEFSTLVGRALSHRVSHSAARNVCATIGKHTEKEKFIFDPLFASTVYQSHLT